MSGLGQDHAAGGRVSTDLLGEVLAACERYGDAPAITFGRTTVTYRQLRERVLGVASSLTGLGFAPGDRVLFSVRPGLDGICLALGIIAAGGTVVFADPGAGESMFRARAGLARPRWVAAESLLYFASSAPLRPLARSRGLELPRYSTVVPDATHLYAGPWLPGVPRGAVPVSRLLAVDRAPVSTARSGGAAAPAPTAPQAEALIIFTSGTTAKPKAVVHSRGSLGTGFVDFAARVRLAAGDRVLTDQLMVGIPAIIAGAHWSLPPFGANPGAKPAQYLDLLPGADVLFAVPAALDSLLRLLDEHPEQTPRLTKLLVGGAPVLRPLLERVRARLPHTEIIAIYGMTEILPVAMADGDEKLAFTGAGDFVGELMPSVDARIVDGELVLAGPGLALGYLGDEPLSELRTGDLARIENGGAAGRAEAHAGDSPEKPSAADASAAAPSAPRLVLTGRSKDMFIRGTTNVYPGLYEPVIAGLTGVREAAMVGVPDAIGDDAIVLVLEVEGVLKDARGGFVREHGVVASVQQALPGLIDAAVLPDVVLATAALPRAGRSSKLDRAALARAVGEFLA